MILVGLSGGIGQGKSTVGKMLRQLGKVGPDCDLESSYVVTDVLNAWLIEWPQPLDRSTDLIDLANQLIQLLPEVVSSFSPYRVTADDLQILRTDSSRAANAKLMEYLQNRRQSNNENVEFPLPLTPENKGLHRDLMQWIGAVMVEKVNGRFWSDITGARVDQLKAVGHDCVTVGGIRSEGDAAMIRERGGVVVRVLRPGATADNDPTETWMNSWKADVEVINNGSLEELHQTVQNFWDDLGAGKVKPAYQAKT